MRYQQGHGLCRTCERSPLTTRDRERAIVEALEARDKMLRRAEVKARTPRELEADGQLFDVVWDGSND